jgi:hypothetical protein
VSFQMHTSASNCGSLRRCRPSNLAGARPQQLVERRSRRLGEGPASRGIDPQQADLSCARSPLALPTNAASPSAARPSPSFDVPSRANPTPRNRDGRRNGTPKANRRTGRRVRRRRIRNRSHRNTRPRRLGGWWPRTPPSRSQRHRQEPVFASQYSNEGDQHGECQPCTTLKLRVIAER